MRLRIECLFRQISFPLDCLVLKDYAAVSYATSPFFYMYDIITGVHKYFFDSTQFVTMSAGMLKVA